MIRASKDEQDFPGASQTKEMSCAKALRHGPGQHEIAQSGNYKRLDVAEVSEMRWQVWNLNLERQLEVLLISWEKPTV